jgi:hypothetical protein
MNNNEKEVEDMTEEELSQKEEEYGKIPKTVLNAFDNTEDVLEHITDDGLDALNHESMKECRILNLGIELTFTNRNNKPFRVIFCPDVLTNDDNMRRTLYVSGKSIEKNYPHIAGNEVSRHKGV